MRHLYNSVVRAEQLQLTQIDGVRSTGWVPAGSTADEKALLSYLSCRLDLQFVRPGKDAPVAIQAGQAPERAGLMLCGPEYSGVLKAGMRLITIPNAIGKEPVKGIFDVRVIPDVALGFDEAHHVEVQVFEMLQRNLSAKLPAADGSYSTDLDALLGGRAS